MTITETIMTMTDQVFKLPNKNEEVPLPKLMEICKHYNLPDLWTKIKKDPPALAFSSDGCTMWPDITNGKDIYAACFLHDLKYWSGYPGEDVDRLVADAQLMIDVARIRNSTKIAETMFHGVRVGGTDKFKLAFSWGFGRVI